MILKAKANEKYKAWKQSWEAARERRRQKWIRIKKAIYDWLEKVYKTVRDWIVKIYNVIRDAVK